LIRVIVSGRNYFYFYVTLFLVSLSGLKPMVDVISFMGRKNLFYIGSVSETGFVLHSHWSETCQTTLNAPRFLSTPSWARLLVGKLHKRLLSI